MNRFIGYAVSALACVALFGCAHPINMNPDLAALAAPANAKVINKRAGYHMPDALRALEVTTPGGGGDKVRYFPYRDIEPGFYKALSEVFTSVTKVQNPKDLAALQAGGVALLITPEVTTTSYSDGAFTWPPTQFSVKLVCDITDANGKAVQTVTVTGNGAATFDEFKANFSLAAVRASNEALAKLIQALAESPELRK
ncbi:MULTISPECIES: hypothetical protein [unclassified Polaromonas]|uniref:hypothetical protein n=1 Tax=unclassified Polaromonas TaxID=2638319 RepID=UPI000F080463|nr:MULTISPECIES: hypothetical protein [unclassified Polaromonas]AYQ28269.1 hypothetical protein DT070_09725 [Polaromonas sp. SP1]QGJ20610.1 hypothetical protein F7R28_20900 [Polaromonas sp. Pch-P]